MLRMVRHQIATESSGFLAGAWDNARPEAFEIEKSFDCIKAEKETRKAADGDCALEVVDQKVERYNQRRLFRARGD